MVSARLATLREPRVSEHQAVERAAFEGGEQRVGGGLDRRLTRERAAGDEAHLAEEFAGADDVEEASALRHLRIALGEEVQAVALLAFADDYLAGRRAGPLAALKAW